MYFSYHERPRYNAFPVFKLFALKVDDLTNLKNKTELKIHIYYLLRSKYPIMKNFKHQFFLPSFQSHNSKRNRIPQRNKIELANSSFVLKIHIIYHIPNQFFKMTTRNRSHKQSHKQINKTEFSNSSFLLKIHIIYQISDY